MNAYLESERWRDHSQASLWSSFDHEFRAMINEVLPEEFEEDYPLSSNVPDVHSEKASASEQNFHMEASLDTNDLLFLAEFDDILGQRILLTCPRVSQEKMRKLEKQLDAVFGVNFQDTGNRSSMVLPEDSQAFLPDSKPPCFVRYMTAQDADGRGFARSCCVAYFVQDKLTLQRKYPAIMQALTDLFHFLKVRNAHVFLKDIRCKIRDLEFTKKMLLNSSSLDVESRLALSTTDRETLEDNIDGATQARNLVEKFLQQQDPDKDTSRSQGSSVNAPVSSIDSLTSSQARIVRPINLEASNPHRQLKDLFSLCDTNEQDLSNRLFDLIKLVNLRQESVSSCLSVHMGVSHTHPSWQPRAMLPNHLVGCSRVEKESSDHLLQRFQSISGSSIGSFKSVNSSTSSLEEETLLRSAKSSEGEGEDETVYYSDTSSTETTRYRGSTVVTGIQLSLTLKDEGLFCDPRRAKQHVYAFMNLLREAPRCTLQAVTSLLSGRRVIIYARDQSDVCTALSGMKLFLPLCMGEAVCQWRGHGFPRLPDLHNYVLLGVPLAATTIPDMHNTCMKNFVSVFDLRKRKYYGPVYTKGIFCHLMEDKCRANLLYCMETACTTFYRYLYELGTLTRTCLSLFAIRNCRYDQKQKLSDYINIHKKLMAELNAIGYSPNDSLIGKHLALLVLRANCGKTSLSSSTLVGQYSPVSIVTDP